MSTKHTPRRLDHLVLPVADVDIARSRYEKLGFTVAPTGVHPFGTENCCVFFEDETFLEPIAIAQRETCEAAALAGNTFVANDQTYRFRRGNEGFSHLVLKSDDAAADKTLYEATGLDGGDMVHFSRAFSTPDGQSGEVSFELAFAGDQRAPDAQFFTCQVLNAPKVDRSALQAHANGVVGLKEVILSEPNPTDFQYFFQTYLNQRHMDVDSFGMSFTTHGGVEGAQVSVYSPDGMRAFFGMDTERDERGLRFEAFILAVTDLSATRTLLVANSVAFDELRGRIVVRPPEDEAAGQATGSNHGTGQGTTMIFEEVA
ncbi:VOC family protein [Ahrensia sp. R2A130]|uniref:VOC family protein n=1 Tax=Ahrensia sp. R2A130 TaxID=744979 RepID=UPI0001E0E04F|nr:VOC family protein [Ahrensia sp. R2A130]EFL90346.1 conserved hypothetical protein [Ahrensia sp. R2A130]